MGRREGHQAQIAQRAFLEVPGHSSETLYDEIYQADGSAATPHGPVSVTIDADLKIWYLFDTTKTLEPEQSLGPTFSITRASTAWYFDSDGVLQSASNNVARFDHTPQTGATSFGLLVERTKTNSCLHSQDFSNAAWVKTNVTAAKDATGLDGSANSASTLTATDANGTCFQTVTLGSAAYTFSVWVKRKTGTGTVEITDNNGSNYTDITSSINSSTFSRVEITRTQANPVVGFRLVTDTDEIEVDVAQVEAGSFASSPIITAGSAVTRADDDISATLSTTVTSTTSGVYFRVRSPAIGKGGSAYAWQLQEDGGAGTPNWYAFSRGSTASRVDVDYRAESGNPGDVELGTATPLVANTEHKFCVAIAGNDYRGQVDSQTADTDTDVGVGTSDFDTIYMGNTGGGSHWDGWIAEWQFYSRRLTNAEIDSLCTTGALP